MVRTNNAGKTRAIAVKKASGVVLGGKKSVEAKQGPRSLAIAQRGIRTGSEFAGMMSALMSDVIEGAITPQVANATVNAGGKLLKVVELTLKYGSTNADGSSRNLDLVSTVESR